MTKQREREAGFALVSAMVILMILVLLGIGGVNSSYFENLIATNDKIIKQEIYIQDNCLGEAKVKYREWLTDAYLNMPEATAFYPPVGGVDVDGDGFNDDLCLDENGNVVGVFKIRNVENTGAPINNWADIGDYANIANHPANLFPPQDHVDIPIPGTGYDDGFRIRRYVGTAYSQDNRRNVIVQQGIYKAFNKF